MTEVVGRGSTGSNKPPAKPSLQFPTLGRGTASNTTIDAINSWITSTKGFQDFNVNTVPDVQTDEFISGLSGAQKRTLASLMRKAGFTIRTVENVETEISENFTDLDTSSFSKFYKSLAAQLIPKEGKGPKEYVPRIDVYNVPDTELESDIDEASLSALGAILTPEEKAKFLPIQKALMAKGSRTTQSLTKKGELRTETTPGFTREMGKEAVEEAIIAAPEYKADVERKQRVDFFKWMGGAG